MTKFSDYNAAVRTREIITKLAKEAIEKHRPQLRHATVESVDRIAMKASVIMEYGTKPVTLNIPHSSGPFDAGDIVLVDTSLGSMKVERLVYSPVTPSGVFIRPGLVSPIEIGETGFGAVQRELIMAPQDMGTFPYFLGRWVLNDSALYYESGGYTVGSLLHFEVNIENICGWELAVNLQFPSMGWVLVSPAWFFDVSNGPTFILEYQIDVDEDGRLYVELRARYSGVAAYLNYDDFPWSINISTHGNATKDPNFVPVKSVGSISATENFSPGPGDSGVHVISVFNGWVINATGPAQALLSGSFRVKNGHVEASLTLQVQTAITVPGDGNLVNTVFGTVPDWMRPQITAKFTTLGTGPVCAGYVSAVNGNVVLTAISPGATLPVLTELDIGFDYDL